MASTSEDKAEQKKEISHGAKMKTCTLYFLAKMKRIVVILSPAVAAGQQGSCVVGVHEKCRGQLGGLRFAFGGDIMGMTSTPPCF